jgi:hypothetical protein
MTILKCIHKVKWKIKYGEYYNDVSRRDYMIIRFYQIQLLFRRMLRWIILMIKEWFNLTFIISTIAILVYLLLAYYIGNYYKGYGLRRTLWDNKNILFTFLVAPNLIKFSINTNRKKSNTARRHDMYIDLYTSFDYIVKLFFKDKLGINYIDGCMYTKDGFEDIKSEIDIVKVYTKDFIAFSKDLEEELPIVKISKEMEFYFNDEKEISAIKIITETYERRYKDIIARTNGEEFVFIDTVWKVIEYYFDFIQSFGTNEKYRIDIGIQRKIVKICMKSDNNHEWLKRQYDLASMSRIGYEIPDSDYDYG